MITFTRKAKYKVIKSIERMNELQTIIQSTYSFDTAHRVSKAMEEEGIKLNKVISLYGENIQWGTK